MTTFRPRISVPEDSSSAGDNDTGEGAARFRPVMRNRRRNIDNDDDGEHLGVSDIEDIEDARPAYNVPARVSNLFGNDEEDDNDGGNGGGGGLAAIRLQMLRGQRANANGGDSESAGGGEDDENNNANQQQQQQQQQRQGIRRGRDDYEGAEPDDDLGRTRNEDMSPEDQEEVPIYYHVPTSDIAEVWRELGRPGPRHECFGCNYVGMNLSALVPDTRLKELFQTMAEGIGVTWPAALAVQVSRQFESWRTNVNKTRGDLDKLPKWSPASVLDHWFNHTQDPEIQQWLDMAHLRYSMNKIRSSCLEKRNRFTGTEIHDREQWSIYRDAMRTWYTITRMEPRKMSFYCEGRMLDRDSLTNKGMYVKTRPIYNFFQRNNKKIRTAQDARNRRNA